jgi:ribose transport system permease protein
MQEKNMRNRTIGKEQSIDKEQTISKVLSFLFNLMVHYGIVVVWFILIIVALILYPRFLSFQNILNILSQNAPIGIIAVGMTFVMLAGGFDLSVGSIVGLGATFFASFALRTSLFTAAIIAIIAGLAVGGINGININRLRVNPFIATLGAASVINGLMLIYSHTQPYVVSDPAFQGLGTGKIGPINTSIIVLAIVFIAGGIILSWTKYGRNIYAIGGNAEASHLSGIRVEWIRTTTYALSGFLAALAGIIVASRLGVGQANMGATMTLDAIAIVVVGGNSLLGGEGAMWRTLVGLLVLATLTNIFYTVDVDPNWQLVAKGLIIIAAVALDSLKPKKA